MLEFTGPNAEQIQYWNETVGSKWVEHQERLNAFIGVFGLQAMDRLTLGPGERVLDVGCGCGDTTVEIARRVGPTGAVTGIDISAPMLKRARESAAALGLGRVRFINADAQTYPFEPGSLDLFFSRFGIMFFTDPEQAFANLHTALRPGGRFAFVCWQSMPMNLWARIPSEAVLKHIDLPPPLPNAPGPFAFADPQRVRRILTGAGFEDLIFEASIESPAIGGGGNLNQAVEFLSQMGPAASAMRKADPEKRPLLLGALRDALAPFERPGGVRMQAAVWIVRGIRPLE